MKEVLFIRHGETDHNRACRYTGHFDISLNENGREQARALKAKFMAAGVARIYSSDLKRCRETAAIVSDDSDTIVMSELREMNFGIFETKTRDEIMISHADTFNQWQNDRLKYRIPGGESYNDMSERVLTAIQKILNCTEDIVAVVSHSGCVRAILSHYLLGSVNDQWRFFIDNCTITRLCFDGDYAYLKSLNEK